MRIYRLLSWFLALTVGLFLCGGIRALFEGETFPIFSWHLFSTVPQPASSDGAVLLLEIDGRRFEPPLDYMSSFEIVPHAGDVTVYFVIQDMAREYLADPAGKGAAKYRSLFEQQYLNFYKRSIRYALVGRSYDPIERWKTDRYKVTRTIFRRTLDQ